MTSTVPAADASSWPHRWAVLLVCATFPLIWVGGLVTTYQAGMAVPDWPNTYGYNLFLYPWQTWLFGPFDLLIEHGHRLLGALVGLISIAAALAAWRSETRPAVRWLAWATVPAVIVQGVLGGLRVRMDQQVLALVHGCTGPAFFALAVALATVTSTRWRGAQPQPTADAGRVQRLAVGAVVLAYLQIVIGANVRHVMAVGNRAWFQVAVVFHLLLAAALVGHVIGLWQRTGALGEKGRLLRGPANWLAACLVAQVALGAATWVVNYGWPVWFRGFVWAESFTVSAESMSQALCTTAHVANGSLILGLSMCLALRAFRALAPATVPLGGAALLGVLA